MVENKNKQRKDYIINIAHSCIWSELEIHLLIAIEDSNGFIHAISPLGMVYEIDNMKSFYIRLPVAMA